MAIIRAMVYHLQAVHSSIAGIKCRLCISKIPKIPCVLNMLNRDITLKHLFHMFLNLVTLAQFHCLILNFVDRHSFRLIKSKL